MIFEDILYEERDSTAYISINRPQVMNAFRGRTMDELLHAILKAGWDKKIASIVLSGTGDRAFCTGGDTNPPVEMETDTRGSRTWLPMPVPEYVPSNSLTTAGCS